MDVQAVEVTDIVPDDAQESTLSIADHARQFGPQAEPPAKADSQPKPDELKPIRPVDQQNRDQGQFAEGKKRMKASDAVKTINKLTARAKTAEEERDATRSRLAVAERELADLKARGASPSQIQRAEEKVERAEERVSAPASTFREPEPKEDDPKYADDYARFLRDVAAWEGRKAYHDARTEGERQAARQQQDAAEHEITKAWAGRIETARGKHADFDAVAFGATRIPADSAIDRFVMEDEAGPEVLYYLNQHPDEVDSLLRMTPTQQMRRLVAKATELSPPPAPAGSTGSAVGRKPVDALPTPPNPVRTEAQRPGSTPPPTDGSLSIAEHQKHFGRARR